jgi:hypothetical protein
VSIETTAGETRLTMGEKEVGASPAGATMIGWPGAGGAAYDFPISPRTK